ncbi:MAG: hypothetical protein HY903_18320 [Deltaproteobacteria bacterium]|nr:hypothetical protein [Deltaproteobacteria bacterium]
MVVAIGSCSQKPTAESTPAVFVNPTVLEVLAGAPGGPGNIDGVGAGARFLGPAGLSVDNAGHLFIADSGGGLLRRAVPATGEVTTVADLMDPFVFLAGAILATDGQLYFASSNTIRRFDLASRAITTVAGVDGVYGWADGVGAAATLSSVWSLATDGLGVIYFGDGNTVRRYEVASGQVTTIAGDWREIGSEDGVGANARFASLHGIAYDGSGNLYVADGFNATIRRVELSTG